MDNVELYRRVEWVTKSWNPSHLEVRIEDRDILHLLVVSEQFVGIPFTKRFAQLSQLFEDRGADIAKEFTLIFEAWTTAEFAKI